MIHTNLSKEQKSKFPPYSNRADRFSSGERILYYLNGKQIASTDLPEGSFQDERIMLAEMIGLEDFDDFQFIDSKGNVRLKASEIRSPFPGLDSKDHLGKTESQKYKEHRENKDRSVK